jgi:hypothetical protein
MYRILRHILRGFRGAPVEISGVYCCCASASAAAQEDFKKLLGGRLFNFYTNYFLLEGGINSLRKCLSGPRPLCALAHISSNSSFIDVPFTALLLLFCFHIARTALIAAIADPTHSMSPVVSPAS